MNTPDNPTPVNNPNDPKVNAAGQDIVTNSDDAANATNKDGAVADTGAIEETLSEDDASSALNADNHITNNDSAGTDPLEADEQF
ncbi:hypothetical protein [Mucilaginibacter phyllosphaerae]|uniref:Uncharacterized protein n=1 Tax=Mucilaginibacter phyllosphaerae TaxID=1812349 RepID=A0A4Y8AF37_9SPHI|nr:hypothetical protein [Mucilaginibacter phyllosphaerae]MBB3969012.1 hypothetical protein [Mucilaginibacter phyllosphaerae]TEW67370.1 hypothetical protein E2R65_05105 [Mucilaginibacter phyllosphaerae]GGH22949.1 hypothetical protein GCM10007352_36600 [Mucilaginibacter phyllosphaerae]